MNPLPSFAAALLPANAEAPRGLHGRNRSDAGQRFGIHRNNVMSSLVRALEDGFPVTRLLVGEEFFRAMAREYVRAQPPRSPVLLEYGAGLPAFVDTFEPAVGLPYLGDMVRLERARVDAFHAADATSLPAQHFADWLASPERLMHCRVRLHPSLRLLRGLRPVLDLWQAHAPGHTHRLAPALDAALGSDREDLLVLRPDAEVVASRLPTGAAALLAALATGEALGDALEQAAVVPGFDLQSALAVLVQSGATVALQP